MFSSALRKTSLTIPNLFLRNNQALVFTSSRFFGAKQKISPYENAAKMNRNINHTNERSIDYKIRKHEAEEEDPQFIVSKQRGQHFRDEQVAAAKDNVAVGPDGMKVVASGIIPEASRKRINRRPGSPSVGIPNNNLIDARPHKLK